MTKMPLSAMLFAAAMIAAPGHAATFDFPSDMTSFSSATNGTGTIPASGQSAYMWTAGDYITQTITGTGLSAVSGFSNAFSYWTNLDADLTVAVLVNGTQVGSFTLNPCSNCDVADDESLSFSFAPISASGDYTISYVLQNTIAPGLGSIAFLDGGTGTLTGEGAVPEPATWALMLAGFGCVGFVMRRRAQQAAVSFV